MTKKRKLKAKKSIVAVATPVVNVTKTITKAIKKGAKKLKFW